VFRLWLIRQFVRCTRPAAFNAGASAACATLLLSGVAGCAYLPAEGPSGSTVQNAGRKSEPPRIQIVDVDESIADALVRRHTVRTFTETLPTAATSALPLGPGDVVEVSIWEAPPPSLFGAGVPSLDTRGAALRPTTIPDQVIDADGLISVPFAGKIKAAGKSLAAVESEIVERLAGKAHAPEVLVRLTHNSSRNVTVVGEFTQSVRVPLTPTRERLLDAVAAAGGVRQPVNKVMIQITRGSNVQAMPLETIIRDPLQNVPLEPGDVVTAMFEPLSYTALGASGKSAEINFEAQGITLVQALARAGGLVDSQSDPHGVFVFRFEREEAITWPHGPTVATPDGLVPVVYRFDFADPSTFFVMQSFPISNRDVLYVSTAPAAQLQKFLNLVFSVIYPILNARAAFGY
jgi:polysaccharide biosynthesis/export protein